jgi:hypothetical protein
LVSLYLAYWVSAWLLGPRYYFEALPGLALLSAAGIIWLAGWQLTQKGEKPSQGKLRPIAIGGFVVLLVLSNFYYYLPARLGGLKGLYGIERADIAIFESPELDAYHPALIIVQSERWMPYGSTLILESPELDSPMIFAWSLGPRTDRRMAEHFSQERNILYYYPDQNPLKLYTSPHSGSLIE